RRGHGADRADRGLPGERGQRRSCPERAGFREVEVRTLILEWGFSLDLFLSDRAFSAPGRFARQALGPEAGRRFEARAREALGAAFGPWFTSARSVLIGRGRKG
ncbi:MAG TPA: hypothetical protein VLI67_07810, partial [Vicinamibacteria bacterium]|nr:hypothetical protein [Vicinamibacteria bacterium]